MSDQLLRFQITVSADGYMAGPNQSPDEPLGVGGEELHEWALKLEAWRESHGYEGGESNPSSAVIAYGTEDVGATIMGRKMFGGGPGEWATGEDEWKGWWGDEPPFHHPVYVLTHFAREPLELEGTTFHFVTDGIESALEQAREAAGSKHVAIGGGAETVRQYLLAGLVDEFFLTTSPVILGDGERPIDGLAEAGLKLELVEGFAGPDAVHARYRVVR